jgi:hypothetical protein
MQYQKTMNPKQKNYIFLILKILTNTKYIKVLKKITSKWYGKLQNIVNYTNYIFQNIVFGNLTTIVNTVPPLVILSDIIDYGYCTRHGTCFPLCFY